MRALLRVACAAALLACSDANAPVAVTSPRRHLPVFAGPHGDSVRIFSELDARAVPERVADLVSRNLVRVALPADAYSLTADAVHPDIACASDSWNGAKCWLMYTPYKNSDATYENPAFLVAASDITWRTPQSITNPIVPFPGVGSYNSDPDHAFDPGTGRLVQVYRVVADGFNKIMVMSTANARTWTTATVAFKEKNHDAVSPSMIIDADRSARLWYVRAGGEGCSAKSSSVQMRMAQPAASEPFERAKWSTARPVDLAIPNYVIWHLDVAALPNSRGYVALIVAYVKGASCSYSELWLATSPDGHHWRNFAMPLFWRSMKVATQRQISTWYRGTMRYDAATDSLHIWPSALSGSSWQIFHTAVKLEEVTDLLALAQPSDYKSLYRISPPVNAFARTIEMP